MTGAAPQASSPGVRARMQKQLRGGTTPEIELRRWLHARGYRFRVARPVPGLARRTVDVTFVREKVAVTVLGCFWHGCPLHGTLPNANQEWWRTKLLRNQERDLETRKHLEDLGWEVLDVWEHEPADAAGPRVVEALLRSRVALRLRPHLGRPEA